MNGTRTIPDYSTYARPPQPSPPVRLSAGQFDLEKYPNAGKTLGNSGMPAGPAEYGVGMSTWSEEHSARIAKSPIEDQHYGSPYKDHFLDQWLLDHDAGYGRNELPDPSSAYAILLRYYEDCLTRVVDAQHAEQLLELIEKIRDLSDA